MISAVQITVILDNIRSAYNVGSIFRTSDAVSIEAIYLLGVTPAPVDKFGREVKDLTKVSLGAEKNIPWKRVASATRLINKLKSEGYLIIALEQAEKSVDYRKLNLKPNAKVAIILGNEVDGVSRKLLNLSDKIVELPMTGKKESLNVSVAYGIFAYALAFGSSEL